jgi:hypothetical protein
VTGKKLSNFSDGEDDCVGEVLFSQVGADVRRDFVPERLAAFRVNASIADDGEPRSVFALGARSELLSPHLHGDTSIVNDWGVPANFSIEVCSTL